MIGASNNTGIFTILLFTVVVGMFLERKGWSLNIAGVIIAIILAAALVGLGVIPPSTEEVSAYKFINGHLLPLSIILFLFGADIKKVIRKSQRLLKIYLLGSLGIVLGVLLAFALTSNLIGADAYKLAGTFTATLIGGSVNFIATSETFQFSQSPLFASSLAVDNVLVTLFILFLFVIPKLLIFKKHFPYQSNRGNEKETNENKDFEASEFDTENLALVITISVAICALSLALSAYLDYLIESELNWSILTSVSLTLLLVNLFPKYFQRLEDIAFKIGLFFMYLFLAVIGTGTDVPQIIQVGPWIVIFCFIILITHLSIMLLAAKFFKIALIEIVLASAANVGGPSISGPMAANLGSKQLITPAILIGVLGYAIGTFIGVSTGYILK